MRSFVYRSRYDYHPHNNWFSNNKHYDDNNEDDYEEDIE